MYDSLKGGKPFFNSATEPACVRSNTLSMPAINGELILGFLKVLTIVFMDLPLLRRNYTTGEGIVKQEAVICGHAWIWAALNEDNEDCHSPLWLLQLPDIGQM